MTPTHHLIDVRTPSEFSTGYLTSDLAPTINIEYQQISTLASVYASRGISVSKQDHITLYCRSGRRSNLALQTLKDLGYENVRDIGGYDQAKKILDRETVERQLEEGWRDEIAEANGGVKEGAGKGMGEERVKSFGVLVEGLKALEG